MFILLKLNISCEYHRLFGISNVWIRWSYLQLWKGRYIEGQVYSLQWSCAFVSNVWFMSPIKYFGFRHVKRLYFGQQICYKSCESISLKNHAAVWSAIDLWRIARTGEHFGDASWSRAKSKELDLAYARDSDSFWFSSASGGFDPPKISGGLQQASLSQNAQWRSQNPFKPCAEFCNLFVGNNTSIVSWMFV